MDIYWEGQTGVVGRWVVEGKVGGGVEWTEGKWRGVMEGTILVKIMIKYTLGPNRLFCIARVDFHASSPCAIAQEEDATWVKVLMIVGAMKIAECWKS